MAARHHPGVKVIGRDRCGFNALTAREGVPRRGEVACIPDAARSKESRIEADVARVFRGIPGAMLERRQTARQAIAP